MLGLIQEGSFIMFRFLPPAHHCEQTLISDLLPDTCRVQVNSKTLFLVEGGSWYTKCYSKTPAAGLPTGHTKHLYRFYTLCLSLSFTASCSTCQWAPHPHPVLLLHLKWNKYGWETACSQLLDLQVAKLDPQSRYAYSEWKQSPLVSSILWRTDIFKGRSRQVILAAAFVRNHMGEKGKMSEETEVHYNNDCQCHTSVFMQSRAFWQALLTVVNFAYAQRMPLSTEHGGRTQ